MKIGIEDQSKNFKVRNYAIRNIEWVNDDNEIIPRKYFQVVVEDLRSNRNRVLHCMLTYKGGDGEFLGFDERSISSATRRTEVPISMPISVPENATEAIFKIEELRDKREDEFIKVIAMAFIGAVIVFLIKVFVDK